MKNIHLIGGMPRSGTALLTNVLAQNPRFHLTSPGGIFAPLFLVRNRWNRMVNFRATPNEAGKVRVLKAVLEGYYEGVDKPVIFDHSLGWLSGIEMAEFLLGRPMKMLVCVRDIRDVMASFEMNWRRNPAMKKAVEKFPNRKEWDTLEGRCGVWANGEQPVGMAYNQIKDAKTRGYADRMHFVVFDKMMTNPKETLQGIYEFLGESSFEHNFENITQVIWENYALYGIPERHNIPVVIKPVPSIWPRVLGQVGQRYAKHELW
jgi:sulfotransferase